MGAWGTSLYSSDIARDVRDDYREMLVLKYTHEQAVEMIIKEHQLSENDPYDASGWYALADSAWRYGFLNDKLLSLAQKIKDSEIEKELWDNPKEWDKRKEVIRKLYNKIQNPPEKVSKPHILMPLKTDWQEGDLLAFKLQDGQFAGRYIVILIVQRDDRKISRFARDTDVVAEYHFVVTTYLSEMHPSVSSIGKTIEIYCNHDDIERQSARYKKSIERNTARIYINPYDLTKKVSKMLQLVGRIEPELLAEIQNDTMWSFMHDRDPLVWGRLMFEPLYEQNHTIVYSSAIQRWR